MTQGDDFGNRFEVGLGGKSFINFSYRLSSLFFILIILFLSKEKMVLNNPELAKFFVISLFLNVFYTLYQIFVYQKSQFSNTESFSFLEIIFSTLIALVFFKQVPTDINEILGITIIVLSLLIIAFKEIKMGNFREIIHIIFYYSIYSLVHNFNQQTTYRSSPLTFTLLTTAGLVLVNLAIMVFNPSHSHLNYKNSKKTFPQLAIIGFLTTLGFIGSAYSYQFLPISIAVTLFNTKTFFSLWLSHKKYGEKNLGYKVLASALAFTGVIVLML